MKRTILTLATLTLGTTALAAPKLEVVEQYHRDLDPKDKLAPALKKAAAKLGAPDDVFEGVFARWLVKSDGTCRAFTIEDDAGEGVFGSLDDIDLAMCSWKKAAPARASAFGKPFTPRAALSDGTAVRVFDFTATCDHMGPGAEMPMGARWLEATVEWKSGAKAKLDQDNAQFEIRRPDGQLNTIRKIDDGEVTVVSATSTKGALSKIKLKAKHAKNQLAATTKDADFEPETEDLVDGELDVRVCR